MARLNREQTRARANALHQAIFETDMSPEMAVREFDAAAEIAGKEVLWHWFTNIYPNNFKLGAARRRGYKPRNPGYQFRKSKIRPRGGLESPPLPALVYRGFWKQQTLAAPQRVPKMRRTAGGYVWDMVVVVPQYVRQNRSIPDMAREATYRTAKDLAEMDAVFDSNMVALLTGHSLQRAA